MLEKRNGYDGEMLATMGMNAVNAEEITKLLGEYLERYKSCFENRSQEKYCSVPRHRNLIGRRWRA